MVRLVGRVFLPLGPTFEANKCHNHNDNIYYCLIEHKFIWFDSHHVQYCICVLQVRRKPWPFTESISHQKWLLLWHSSSDSAAACFCCHRLGNEALTSFWLCGIFLSEYLMTGSPRTAGYPARSPINSDAPNHHRYVLILILAWCSKAFETTKCFFWE